MLQRLLFNIRMSFRMWVRNRTRPLTFEEAEEKKIFWSKIYLATGIIGFCYVTVSTFSNRGSDVYSDFLPVSQGILNKRKETDKFRVIKYSGLTRVSDETFTLKEATERKEKEDAAKESNKTD